MMNMTPEAVKKLSYTDFIGLINQWNVLPGAFTTLNKWINYSNINNKSYILEVACSTGFSSREISSLTNCSGVGIDISKSSIEQARYNLKEYAPKVNIKYINIDGYKYQPDKTFTHIIFGSSLRFFDNPEKMLNRCFPMLKDNGFILSSEFFVKKQIPLYLVKKAKSIFNLNITQVEYKKVMKMYKGLEVLYEDKNDLVSETKEELEHYCKSTIDRAAKRLNLKSKIVYKTMFNRLYDIKEMSNLLRPYQRYNVLVLRYKKNIYPNRFIELF